MAEQQHGRNGFSEAEEALIEKIAFGVWDKIKENIENGQQQAIQTHSLNCVANKWVGRLWWIVVGFVGLGIYMGVTWIRAVAQAAQVVKP